ncbi:MAG: 3-methyl-2-oxobutanoate hydroxymethyltransferase [Anaerolineaceae bacterium]|nr:3-methyl-2-oxobutanoate hydroxymethyltransferase [Anaerolineaceae bacterium]
MSTVLPDRKKTSIYTFRKKKEQHSPISVLTAYDTPTARLVDQAGLDAILVGDSVGMAVLGYSTTLPVTMDDMIHHCKAVSRGTKNAFLIGDMPFLSYQVSTPEAVRNAGRFLQEAGMDAVKLEGGKEQAGTIRAIVQVGIPVMGHLGLTPQSVHQLGGFRPQGKLADSAIKLLEDARVLEEAGCFSLVLESIPARLAQFISEHISIPTIGIGAGAGCDGQVLVIHDLLGLLGDFKPKFVKRYINLQEIILQALNTYREDVEQHAFPAPEHCIDMSDEEWQKFLGRAKD